jgi:putative oxidoreductase
MEADRVARVQGFGLAVLRVIIGIVFLAHGLQKIFQFGVGGFAGNLEGQGVPLPLFFAVVVTLVEVLGGVALILGIFTRLVTVPLAIDMLVAMLMVHLPNGFFMMNNGIELTLILLAASVALALAGSGEASLDKVLASRAGNPTLARLVR